MAPKDLVGFATALLALATAWLGYQKLRKESVKLSASAVPVVLIDDNAVRQTPWNMKAIRLGVLGLAPPLGIFGALNLEESWGGMLAGEMLVIAVVFTFIRTRPPSRTRKTARIVVKMSPMDAAKLSLAVVDGLGAKVGRFDASEGFLVASTGITWRSFGEVIVVRIRAQNE
jgi:hypothetical protein